MRILHLVATGQRRGAEIFASDLVASLNRRGAHQRVVVVDGSGSIAVPFAAPVAALEAGSGAPLVRVAPRAVWALRRHLRDFNPDVVQAHGGSTLKYAVIGSVGRPTPVVFRSIGEAPVWIQSGPRRVAYSSLLRGSARIVAVAEAVRRQLIEVFRLPEARVISIPNGVDPRRLEPIQTREATREKLGIAPTDRVLLSMGALTWEKDPLAHLEVSSRIMRQRSAVTHVVIGDGPMRRELQRAIAQRRLGGRVLVLGSRSDVAEILSAAHVVLFASRSDGMEGMPAAIIEACMMGRPVAGYSVAGASEVIVDRQTGLLAPPGDLDALTERALRLIDDEGERGKLGTAARQRVLARYDISTIADSYLSLYSGLLR
jgi:glycosyltransferase involved in cell wall biosynthesis